MAYQGVFLGPQLRETTMSHGVSSVSSCQGEDVPLHVLDSLNPTLSQNFLEARVMNDNPTITLAISHCGTSWGN